MHNDPSPGYASGALAQEITVYPSRRGTWVWLLLGGVSSLLLLLGFLFVVGLMIFIPDARNAGAIFLALFILGMGAVGAWPTFTLVNLLASKEPLLVINHQGIRVGKFYGTFEILLPWEEIAAIYSLGSGLGKQLYLRPTNVTLFLSHFSPLMRFFLRLNLMNGAPIALAQSFLDQPIEEIMHELQERYVQELIDHQVQLRRISV